MSEHDESRDGGRPEAPSPGDAAAGDAAAGDGAPGEAAPGGAPAGEPEAPAPAEAAPSEPPSGDAAAGGTPPAEPEASAEEEAAKKAAAAAAAKAKAEAAAKAKAEAEAAKPPWERDPVVPSWEEAGDDPLASALSSAHGDGLLAARTFAGDLVLDVAPGALRPLAEELKERHGYTLLVDICGAHYPDREEGAFEVVYHLYCFEQNRRVRLRVRTGEDQPVPSLVDLWEGANWPEREAWDMYGIRFAGHPDMTRILMWEGFNGHPLRKEFPIEGVDTGAAIYPEYYEDEAGPVAGTGTGWKPPAPPAPEPEETAEQPPEDA